MKRPTHDATSSGILLSITCIFTRLDPSCAFVDLLTRSNNPRRTQSRNRRHQPRFRSPSRNEIIAAQSSFGEGKERDNGYDSTYTLQGRRDFTPDFQLEFEQLMHWRRDVRRFQKDRPVDEKVLQRAIKSAFRSAPSVGLSEPWRIVRVESERARKAVLKNFEVENADALNGYAGDKRRKYASLKLSGMVEAPVQLAVFCDDGTTKGAGLGARTMPEMRRYSVVSAITLFWLAARSAGIGVGWVSILDAHKLGKDLGVPSDWALVGYLCIGYPEEDNDSPELERCGWETRMGDDDFVIASV